MFDRYVVNEEDLLWYWFVNIPGVGLVARRNLIRCFGHPRYMYEADEKQLAGILTRKQRSALKAAKDKDKLMKGLLKLQEERTRFVHWESVDYPERLRNIPDPPYGFYLRGRLPDPGRPSLAMVGSRRATDYGKRLAADLAAKLARAGVQIISGLAEGIDTAGHQGALAAHGYTLGLLGGGIDSIYPRENFNLYLKMYEEGGVLSEWNIGVENKPGLFPIRNRLISAFSDGVFVVEAARKSGTFITVDQALEQGRTVFALPGRITDVNSSGTNQLIREGAIPVTCVDDILEQLMVEGCCIEQQQYNRPESNYETSHDFSLESGHETSRDFFLESGHVASHDSSSESGHETSHDSSPDSGHVAGNDSSSESGHETSHDFSLESGHVADHDSSSESGHETGHDFSPESGHEARSELTRPGSQHHSYYLTDDNQSSSLHMTDKRICLTDEQRTVYDCLDEQRPVEISELMEKTGYDISSMIHILYGLESSGWIFQPRQNVYLKKILLARENEIVYD